MSDQRSSDQISNRRDFMKTGALITGFPTLMTGATTGNAIKVGLVGCGGRGTGAASQALKADDYSELTAMADIYQERIDASLAALQRTVGPKLKVEKSDQFTGLDAYQKLIDTGVDVVLLATPPGFRPAHLGAAIKAGRHVFCEKPIAVDAPGVRDVLETVKLAKEKNVSLVSGFCWRYSNFIKAAFEQVHGGAIGDIVSYYATYYTSPVKPMPPASQRPAGMSDVDWQIRNWYNFQWLCGDSLVEQAVHSVDKIAWAMKDAPPVSCVAVGGRQIPAEDGNIFDHFEVNYLYPNNVRAFIASRQMEGCYNENADYIVGTKGNCTIGRGPLPRITGATNWTFQGPKNDMYQAEHDALFASIRQNKPINDGQRMATTTMLAIMGRMAAYTGQQITWDDAMNSKERIFPEKLDWDMKLPVAPMPRPGITKFI
ncbi:MAG: Gfo/Idh/MocA family oxidoreductase [Acidobacteriota bacterium]|nr:Gfo/Idh/MocA family oxidoreductase [Acidobacteriota bacterium]